MEKYCRVGQATDDNMAHVDETSTVSSGSRFSLFLVLISQISRKSTFSTFFLKEEIRYFRRDRSPYFKAR